MKYRIMFLAVAALMIAGMSAVTAKADDPSIALNKFTDPPACDPTVDICFDGNALDVPIPMGGGPFTDNFDYTGTTTITSIDLDFKGFTEVQTGFCSITPPSFSPTSNIFATITTTITTVCNPQTGIATADVSLLFSDGNLTPNTLFDIASPDGFKADEQPASVSVAAPEPGSMILMGMGLIPVLGFGRKRWNLNRS
jgi:hypothetical protein